MIDWIVTYIESVQKHRKLSLDVVYLRFPNWTKFDQAIRYFAFFKTILIWMIMHEIFVCCGIAIWGFRNAQIKMLKKTDPNFFSKKIRVCSPQLFDPSTPKASNCDPTARKYFMHNHSYKNNVNVYFSNKKWGINYWNWLKRFLVGLVRMGPSSSGWVWC